MHKLSTPKWMKIYQYTSATGCECECECVLDSVVKAGSTPKCWADVTGLARSDEPELSFLCFFCGLSGFEPLLSPSASISSGLAPSTEC